MDGATAAGRYYVKLVALLAAVPAIGEAAIKLPGAMVSLTEKVRAGILDSLTTGVKRSAAFDGAAAGPVNLMGDKDLFFKNASKRLDIDPNGMFDVVAHGSSQSIEILTAKGPVTIDQRVASKLIEGSPSYTPGQPVRLLSCDTGTCNAGFAQNLANKMGIPVQAPSELVWADSKGNIIVAPRISANPDSPYFNVPDLARQGTFKTFLPGGNKP